MTASPTNLAIAYPIHPNPNIRGVVTKRLAHLPRVTLMPPVTYREMVALLKRCTFVVTDSGGIEEEAPALGKPVLVVRDVTERPEAVDAGVVKILGTNTATIVAEVSKLLLDQNHYRAI